MKESVQHIILRGLRKLYSIFLGKRQSNIKAWTVQDPQIANEIIFDLLSKGHPCMIARFGANEMATLNNYLGIVNPEHNVWQLIMGKQSQWWWNKNIMYNMENNAGFFPVNEEYLAKYSQLLLNDAKYLDVLGSWLDGEQEISYLYPDIPKIMLPYLEPYHSSNPWSRWLYNKKIVVIHPFAKSIQMQYNNRELIFDDLNVLPQFKSLRIIPAVQSIGGNDNGFNDWFEALEYMKSELDKEDYDIALIGCGAYGFHLAAHAKRTGHQAIHLGGALQLLFGIKGKRWENKNYCESWNMPSDSYTRLFNEYWTKPSNDETPRSAANVESACYW